MTKTEATEQQTGKIKKELGFYLKFSNPDKMPLNKHDLCDIETFLKHLIGQTITGIRFHNGNSYNTDIVVDSFIPFCFNLDSQPQPSQPSQPSHEESIVSATLTFDENYSAKDSLDLQLNPDDFNPDNFNPENLEFGYISSITTKGQGNIPVTCPFFVRWYGIKLF